jgi:hypothetical protein
VFPENTFFTEIVKKFLSITPAKCFLCIFRKISIFRKACGIDYETAIKGRTGKQFNSRRCDR